MRTSSGSLYNPISLSSFSLRSHSGSRRSAGLQVMICSFQVGPRISSLISSEMGAGDFPYIPFT